MSTINFWPVLVASIVSIIIGSFWYSPLMFGKMWLKELNCSEEDIAKAKAKGMSGMWKSYLGQIIASLITFYVLAYFMMTTGVQSAGHGAFVGFLAWLGFTVTTSIGSVIWEKRPTKIVLINTFSSFVILVLGGLIIGAW